MPRYRISPPSGQAISQEAQGYSQDAADAVPDRDFTAGEFAPGGGWEVLIARKAG